MNAIAPVVTTETITLLVKRAADQLAAATTAAEVLDVIDDAALAYDAAKRAARVAAAKEVVDRAHKLQGDAVVIEAQAKARLADEYDKAQKDGEVQKPGGRRGNQHSAIVPKQNNAATVEEIGLTRKEVHDARKVRDVVAKKPEAVRQAVDKLIANGKEPTRAAVNRAIFPVTNSNKKPASKPRAASATILSPKSPVMDPISRCAVDVRAAILDVMKEVDPSEWDALLGKVREALENIEQVIAGKRAA